MGKIKTVFSVSLAILFALSALTSNAAVKPNALFSNGAVLQQGMRLPVFGTASDGEKVTVKFQCQTVSAVASGGYWILHLKPLKPGGPFTMKINDLALTNILVGEVWICSGQSNMGFTVSQSENAEPAIASSKDPMLRLLTVPKTDKTGSDLEVSWRECGPETVGTFTAVGYFFGRDLRRDLKVPVGLIDSSVGGTPAEAWTSREVLKASFPYLLESDPPRTGKGRPAALYNAMIAPLQPYGIRGAIWYQGEANAGRAYEYRSLFPAMIGNWRQAWGQGEFPFYFVQLAPFAAAAEGTWPELREAQLLTMKTVPNTAMAVITDIGEEKDIHPKKKEPVGHRLALAARALVYGERIEYSGPIYKEMNVEADKAIIAFDHVDGGLVSSQKQLPGFTICGADGKFIPAQAEIRRDTGVVVWSPDVPNPVAVRYGWSNWMVVDLFNEAGLPASPFRTDDFPMVTKPE